MAGISYVPLEWEFVNKFAYDEVTTGSEGCEYFRGIRRGYICKLWVNHKHCGCQRYPGVWKYIRAVHPESILGLWPLSDENVNSSLALFLQQNHFKPKRVRHNYGHWNIQPLGMYIDLTGE